MFFSRESIIKMYVLSSSDKENETFIWDLESGTIVSTIKDTNPPNNGMKIIYPITLL